MGKTRTMRLNIISLAVVLAMFSLAITLPAVAQTTPGKVIPEVQIDSSVLDELAPTGAANRPVLSRPAAAPQPQQQPVFRPTQQKIVPLAAAPAGTPSKPYAMRRTGNVQPIITREQPAVPAPATEWRVPAAPSQPVAGIRSFPVQQQVRSNSSDPSGAGGLTKSAGTALTPAQVAPRTVMSAPALPPAHDEAMAPGVPTLSRKVPMPVPAPVVLSRPAPAAPAAPVTAAKPERKPAQKIARTKTTQKTAKASTQKILPVPPRKPAVAGMMAANEVLPVPVNRPDQLKLADIEPAAGLSPARPPVAVQVIAPPVPSEQILATPVKKATQAKIAAVGGNLPPTDLPPPPRPGRMPPSVAGSLPNAPKIMPAIPTKKVGTEQLPAVPGFEVADSSDPLLMQLKDFDRQHFIKQVEGITAGLAPVPARKPVRGMPPGLNKSNSAIVTARKDSEEIPDVTASSSAPSDDTAQKLAAIAPAAGGDVFASGKIDKTPRPPVDSERHESAFITVPFMPGDEKASGDVIKRIEAEVIPLLKANPGWRVQIQAFSSPDNEVRSSARRTALSRALSVRELLIDKGIDAPRMDIRALGMETDRDPLDRIDLVFFDPADKS